MHPRLTFTLLYLIICTGMLSCKEEYKNIDPQAFNNKIKENPNIRSAEDLICAYDSTLSMQPSPNTRKPKITCNQIAPDRMEITAKIPVFDDAEWAGEKIIMMAEHNKSHWRVFEIHYNWKYKAWAGHTDWGI